jgi:hypothetical protein
LQAPQCFASLFRLTQVLPQSVFGGVQAMPHCPLVHVATPPCGAAHETLHDPQCVGSWDRLASQPLVASASQLPHPELQEKPQLPALQVAVEWGGCVQAVAQSPQCFGSLPSATHDPPHSVVPDGHWFVHTPFEHTWPTGHFLSHEPQWSALVLVSTHTPPHAVWPDGQLV